MNWALGQPVSKSSAKFVLVVMANHAGTDMTCWPSNKSLTEATGQDIKTVEAGLRRLREEGYVTDTGERRGQTGQVIVYRLNTPEFGGVKPVAKTPEIPSKPPKNGGVVDSGKTPVFPDNTPVFPIKDPQISHETPPKTGDGTIKEPSRNHQEPKDKSSDLFGGLLAEVDPIVMADFKTLRAKQKAPITETAINGIAREARKANLTLTEALRMCCERSWRGFEAKWLEPKNPTAQPRNGSRHAGFDQRNYEGSHDGSIPA